SGTLDSPFVHGTLSLSRLTAGFSRVCAAPATSSASRWTKLKVRRGAVLESLSASAQKTPPAAQRFLRGLIRLTPRHWFEFGPFRVDLLTHRLLRNGEVVALQPKAF